MASTYQQNRHLTTEFRCSHGRCERIRVNLKWSIFVARSVKYIEGLCSSVDGVAKSKCDGLHESNNVTMHMKENCEKVEGCSFDESASAKENATAMVVQGLRKDARLRVFRRCIDRAIHSHALQTTCECRRTMKHGFQRIFGNPERNATEEEDEGIKKCEADAMALRTEKEAKLT